MEDNEKNAESQFTQLSNLIDARVTYGDMNTQISQGVSGGLARSSLSVSGGGYLTMTGTGSTSQVYLGGSNVHIDGNTYIANGIIKSANIESLDAGKITGGDIRGINNIYVNNGSGSSVLSGGQISLSGALTIGGTIISMSGFGGPVPFSGGVTLNNGSNSTVLYVTGGHLYFGNTKLA